MSTTKSSSGVLCCLLSVCLCASTRRTFRNRRGNDAALLLRREAEFLMMLDHPGIVECYDVIDDGNQMVIIMVSPWPAGQGSPGT